MFWFWLNMPLAAVFFGAWCGIPLWMVLRHPHWGPEPADGHSVQLAGPEPVPVFVVDRGEYPVGAMTAGAGAGRR
jgi:hypothetical protein